MNPFCKSHWQTRPLLMCIACGLLILPVSNSVGQIPLYAAGLTWLWQLSRGKSSANRSTWVFLGGWMLLMVLSLLFAVHPEMGIRKLSRLLIFPLVGAVSAVCLQKRERQMAAEEICKALVLGVTLLGVHDLGYFPLKMHGGMAFQDVGNMTSPQFYLVGLVLWLGLISLDRARVSRWWWSCLPFLLSGILLHQKRGVWLACALTIGLWTLWSRRWKTLATLVLLGCLALSLPHVRHRLGELREVVQPTHGGRMVLWTQVAPRILPAYPWGMGYNGSTYEDFRAVLPPGISMEAGLRHLHNNFLQIRLELGWQGLCWWTLWMGSVLLKAFRPRQGERILRHAVGFAFLGLLLNGLVEYNFGDSEVLKVYLVLMGLVDALSAPAETA